MTNSGIIMFAREDKQDIIRGQVSALPVKNQATPRYAKIDKRVYKAGARLFTMLSSRGRLVLTE